MIGFLLFAVTIVAAWQTYDTGLFVVAVVNAVLNGWAYGVMTNFSRNPLNAPNWAAVATFVTGTAGIGFLVYGLLA